MPKTKDVISLAGEINSSGQLIIPMLVPLQERGLFFEHKSTSVIVEIRVKPDTRALWRNRGYWGFAIKTIRKFKLDNEGIEWSNDEAHIYNLYSVLGASPEITNLESGEQVVAFKKEHHTSNMSDEEFKAFYEGVQRHWADKHCIVPDLTPRNVAQDLYGSRKF